MFNTQSTLWSANVRTGQLYAVSKWADAKKIDRSQILLGEFGANRPDPFVPGSRGVTQVGFDNFLQMCRSHTEKQGFRQSCFLWDGTGWNGTKFSSNSFNISRDNTTVPTSTRNALGFL